MFRPFGKLKLYVIVIIANFASLMCGMMVSWPSPVLPKLISADSLSDNPLGRTITPNEESWIASLAAIGGIFGPSLAGLVMEKLGRKPALISVHFPNVLATLTAAFGDDIWYFYVSRVAAGTSIYAAISVGAVYFGEIGESHNRGALFSSTLIFINLGTLLSYCIGPYTSIRDFNLILMGIALVGGFGTWLVVPESPYYLLQKNQSAKALESLGALRGTDQVHEELKVIRENICKIQNDDDNVLLAVFKTKAIRRSFLLALVVTALQQLSGINVIYSYTQMAFEEAGIDLSPDVSSILIGVAQFLSVFITTFGIDRFGRKKLLTFSSFGLAFTLGVLGTFFRYQDQDNENASRINWLPLVCLMLYSVFFNSGLGGIPFLYMGEILPLNVKCAGTSVIMAFYCLVSFLITYFYNDITDGLGISGGFYLFSGSMLAFALFVLICLFETRGKTLKEVNDRLRRTKRTKNVFPKNVPLPD